MRPALRVCHCCPCRVKALEEKAAAAEKARAEAEQRAAAAAGLQEKLSSTEAAAAEADKAAQSAQGNPDKVRKPPSPQPFGLAISARSHSQVAPVIICPNAGGAAGAESREGSGRGAADKKGGGG